MRVTAPDAVVATGHKMSHFVSQQNRQERKGKGQAGENQERIVEGGHDRTAHEKAHQDVALKRRRTQGQQKEHSREP